MAAHVPHTMTSEEKKVVFASSLGWLTSTILTAGRQLCWPVETGNDLYGLLLG